MPTIKELVNTFSSDSRFTKWDHEIAERWLEATQCGNICEDVLTSPAEALPKSKKKHREEIREGTHKFIKRHFDCRPDVVRALDVLFYEFGLENDEKRRGEFFSFVDLYTKEEIRVMLLKYLQPAPGDGGKTREDIAKHFLTSERTIGKYIREMYSSEDLGQRAMILGQPVQINPERGTNFPTSTTHPLFLPLNMAELYTLVSVLSKHVGDEVEGRIIGRILDCTLSQTTEYARQRLDKIDNLNMDALAHRGETVVDFGEAIILSEKEGLQATVKYTDYGEERTHTGLVYRNHRKPDCITVVEDGQPFNVPYRNIIEFSNHCE